MFSFAMYGVGAEVEKATLSSVSRDIELLNKEIYKQKKQFRRLFPESKHHEISREEKSKYELLI